jgi:glyoxylase-like metal-dependent hydrolase (beta-lactamase superfamily II)
MGDKQDAKFFGHYFMHGYDTLMGSLEKKGFRPDDITDVLLTHLHFDHCGGAIKKDGDQLVPAFPNATFWCNEKHWKWATEPNDREKASFLKENILPMQESGKLKMIEVSPLTPFTDNVSVRFAYGHTEAMMLPQINYHGRTIVYMADLIPAAAHIPIPYVMAYDMFPLTTLLEKKAFLEEALANYYVLMFEHDPSIAFCTLHKTERGIRMKEEYQLD